MKTTPRERDPKRNLPFLAGGGKMGALTREKDWSKTAVGAVETWPQSLCTTLSIILHSRFPMFLWWGSELTCFYNDAYRPSLGKDGKHPAILGMSAREAWPEIWDTIYPMIRQVLEGGPSVWNEDQLIPIFRNGHMEDVYWTFSYSPVNDESGKIAGVLVTCSETTEKIKGLEELKASEDQLNFTLDAAALGTWDLNPVTNKFTGNERLKEWFGLTPEEEIELPLALNAILEKDRQKVKDAISSAIAPGSDGIYDIEYTIVNPLTQKEIYVAAKGRAAFDQNNIAVRFSGTLEDITSQAEANQKIQESEYRFRTLIEEASVATALYTGRELSIQYANDMMLNFWGKAKHVIGRPLKEAVPELNGQSFLNILDRVYTCGEPYTGTEEQVELEINGSLQTFYFSFTYKPLRNKDGVIYGIHHMAIDVTSQVKSKMALAESEKRFRDTVKQAPVGITILRGAQFIVEMANAKYLELIDRPESSFIGRPIFDSLPEVKDTVEPLLSRVLNTGLPFQSEEFSVALNRFGKQQSGYFNLLYHPLREEDGFVSGVMVVATEVTESVKAKHSLAESEKQFRNMVMQSPIPMTILRGEDFIIEMANSVMFERIWRKKENEVTGKKIIDVFPELKEQKYEQLLSQVYTTGKAHRETEAIAYVQGDNGLQKFYLDFEYAPLFEKDTNISGIMITVNDVSEKVEARRKAEESEERFRNVADNAPVLIWMSGTDKLCYYFNTAWLNFTGRTMEEEAGYGWAEGIHPDDHKRCVDAYNAAFDTRESFSIEYRLKDEKDTYRWISENGVPRFSCNDIFEGYMGACTDIHEQVIYHNKLKEDEEKLNIIINASELGTWDFDLATNKVTYSARFLEIFDYQSTDAALHADLLARIHPEDLPVRAGAFREAYHTGQLHYISRLLWSDTSIHWIEVKGKVFYDEEHNPVKLIGTIRDITEERNFQQQLLQREHKFRLLADSMPQLVWTSGSNGILDYFNQSVYAYSGLTTEQTKDNGWIQIVHPDEREENIRLWQQSLSTGEEFIFEHRFRRKDGVYRWQLSRAIPQKDETGKIQMWVGTSTDIQEQKMFTQELERQVRERTAELAHLNEALIKSEERYHLMVSEVQHYAILYLNNDGIIENWNKGAEKIKGYEAEEIIGKSFSIFYTDQDRQNNIPQKLLKQARDSGKAIHEGMRVRKDGSLFWANVVITAIRDEHKNVIGFSKVTHDLTDKKQAADRLKLNAEQLAEKNNELEKMNAELQSFAYISSHDLQEPLRKIQIFAARILEKEFLNLSEKGKDHFLRMQQSANRMQKLIQDLLTYSRTNITDRVFVIKDLNDIVDEVKNDLSEAIAETHAVIEVEDLCEVSMIPFQFTQLMHNLIGNAIKFSRPGIPPYIHIKCATVKGNETDVERLFPQKSYCHITIKDNGIGFEAQYKERIFEVFQRLHEKGAYEGTGIGLAIVKKIVENHNGAIAASSEPDQGAQFDIYIPFH